MADPNTNNPDVPEQNLSYNFSNDQISYRFNKYGQLVTPSNKIIDVDLHTERKLMDGVEVNLIYNSKGEQVSEKEAIEIVRNYYQEKSYQRAKDQKEKAQEASKAPETQPTVTNSDKNKTNSEKDNKNNSTTENSSTGTSTDGSSSEGTSSTQDSKKDKGPKYDKLYRYADESGDEYDPSAFNVGVVRNLDKDGNVSYKYIDLETNDEISEDQYKQKAKDYVNKYTGADVKNIDANLEALRSRYEILANSPKNEVNQDSEEQSSVDFGVNDTIVLTDEILANQGLLGFHPINGKILQTKLNETYQDYLGIGLHGHEAEIVKCYRNKLFGSSFQFLDSVDKRFSSVNNYVGYEFLRNFILHSAILHIYPGMPHYQGSVDPFEWLRNLAESGQEGMSDEQTKLTDKNIQELQAKLKEEADNKILEQTKKDSSTEPEYDPKKIGTDQIEKKVKEDQTVNPDQVFALNEETTGSENVKISGTKGNPVKTAIVKTLFSILFRTKYQRRLFGIKYTYEQYMRYVNLMCRSLALFLNLTVMNQIIYPQGTFTNVKVKESKEAPGSVSSKFVTFDTIDWSNYRMIEDSMSYANSVLDSSLNLLGTMFGMTDNDPGTIFSNLLGNTAKVFTKTIAGLGEIALGVGAFSSPTAVVTMASLNAASVAATKQSLAKNYRQNANALAESIKKWDFSYMDYENRINNAKSAEELEQAASKGFWPTVGTALGTATQAIVDSTGLSLIGGGIQLLGSAFKDIFAQYKTVQDKLESRTQSVEFMVEPFSPNEQFSNQTTQAI